MSPTCGIEEAAAMLRVHANTVSDLAQSGQIPAAKIGRAWVFVTDDLVAFVKKQAEAQTKARKNEPHQDEIVPKERKRRPIKARPDLSVY